MLQEKIVLQLREERLEGCAELHIRFKFGYKGFPGCSILGGLVEGGLGLVLDSV